MLWKLWLAARVAGHDYRMVYSWRVLAFSVAPRVVLQVTFFTLIGGLVSAGAGTEFAFLGAVGHAVVLSTVVKAPDIVIDEKIQGTMYRLRLGGLPLPLLYVVRSWMYVAESLGAALLSLGLLGVLLGVGSTPWELVRLLPLYLAVIWSTLALGMVAASLVGPHSSVIVPNGISYLLLVTGGVVGPAERIGGVDQLGTVLPLRHGLDAVRAAAGGEPFLASLGTEVTVGLAWFAIALGVMRLQALRVRRSAIHEGY